MTVFKGFRFLGFGLAAISRKDNVRSGLRYNRCDGGCDRLCWRRDKCQSPFRRLLMKRRIGRSCHAHLNASSLDRTRRLEWTERVPLAEMRPSVLHERNDKGC